MSFNRRTWCGLTVVPIVVVLADCGDKPTSPSGNNSGTGGSGSSCSVPVSVLGCPKGLILATLDGQTFNGGVTNGGAFYTPIPPVPSLGLPAQDSFTAGGITSTSAQVIVTARAKLGQAPIGLNVIDPETRNVSVNAIAVTIPTGGAVAGNWAANVAGGSGTITVDAVSTTAARGSFDVTLASTPGTPATGNRRLVGTFNVTF